MLLDNPEKNVRLTTVLLKSGKCLRGTEEVFHHPMYSLT